MAEAQMPPGCYINKRVGNASQTGEGLFLGDGHLFYHNWDLQLRQLPLPDSGVEAPPPNTLFLPQNIVIGDSILGWCLRPSRPNPSPITLAIQ